MNNQPEPPSCNCRQRQGNYPGKPIAAVTKTTKSIPSVLMGIFIAFFPKCPICWAVYMSMFGSLGLARLPYMPWLLPVLLLFLAFHIFMLFRKVPQNGYLPFALSLAGSVLVVSGRFFFPPEKWLMITGLIMVISGSLLNSFSGFRIPLNQIKKYN